jgi:hypothetical protein
MKATRIALAALIVATCVGVAIAIMWPGKMYEGMKADRLDASKELAKADRLDTLANGS